MQYNATNYCITFNLCLSWMGTGFPLAKLSLNQLMSNRLTELVESFPSISCFFNQMSISSPVLFSDTGRAAKANNIVSIIWLKKTKCHFKDGSLTVRQFLDVYLKDSSIRNPLLLPRRVRKDFLDAPIFLSTINIAISGYLHTLVSWLVVCSVVTFLRFRGTIICVTLLTKNTYTLLVEWKKQHLPGHDRKLYRWYICIVICYFFGLEFTNHCSVTTNRPLAKAEVAEVQPSDVRNLETVPTCVARSMFFKHDLDSWTSDDCCLESHVWHIP